MRRVSSDEAFLNDGLTALATFSPSRGKFAREHSDRLWKQRLFSSTDDDRQPVLRLKRSQLLSQQRCAPGLGMQLRGEIIPNLNPINLWRNETRLFSSA